MKRLAGITSASLLALTVGCTAGSVGGDDIAGDDVPPSTDETLCRAELTLQGTYTITDPQPEEIIGCWAVGNWDFQATVVNNTCDGPPELAATYSFTIERDLAAPDPNYDFIYTVTSPQDPFARLNVQSGGGGICTGVLTLYNADGKGITNLHPAQQTGGAINGHGYWEIHTQDQRPEML
jgi:hypothetical protein